MGREARANPMVQVVARLRRDGQRNLERAARKPITVGRARRARRAALSQQAAQAGVTTAYPRFTPETDG